mmetsp:Transcript_7722/g.7914  ORF Transcript_7722/g.7914 Transcript_7722/m.7914 type:complete len:80 (-) Transcript_7722:298-537(-)
MNKKTTTKFKIHGKKASIITGSTTKIVTLLSTISMNLAFCKNQIPLSAAFLAAMIHWKRLGLYGLDVEHNTVSSSGATN